MTRKNDKKMFKFLVFTGDSTCMFILSQEGVDKKTSLCNELGLQFKVWEVDNAYAIESGT
jgi:hypothetical protein